MYYKLASLLEVFLSLTCSLLFRYWFPPFFYCLLGCVFLGLGVVCNKEGGLGAAVDGIQFLALVEFFIWCWNFLLLLHHPPPPPQNKKCRFGLFLECFEKQDGIDLYRRIVKILLQNFTTSLSKGKGLIHFKKLCAFGLLCFHLPRIYQGFLIWSYIITWEDDADGYDLVVIDAMHKAKYASLICHSCHPHCEAKWVPLAYSFCCL